MAARHELGCIPRVATNDGFEHGRSSIPDENEPRLLVESLVCPRVNERPLLAHKRPGTSAGKGLLTEAG